MSDNQQIPSSQGGQPIHSSYRAQPPGMDLGTRWLMLAAVTLGGVLLAGMGGWALMGHRSTVVPVIEADTRPVRVKPDNAGGMQVAGAEEPAMGDQAGSIHTMAPAAEVPALQALRAQLQPAMPIIPALVIPAPAASAPVPAVAAPPDAPHAAHPAARSPASVALSPVAPPPAASVSPAPAAPASMPAVTAPPDALRAARPAARSSASATPSLAAPLPAAPLPAASASPAPASAAGAGLLVQLAAVDDEPTAQAEWQRLAKRMPDVLGGKRLVMQRAKHDGHEVWRVRTGGFADVADATGFCARVHAKGVACTIANF